MDDPSKTEAAAAMRRMPYAERDVLIAASPTVLDGRKQFEKKRTQADLARQYRFSRKPDGRA